MPVAEQWETSAVSKGSGERDLLVANCFRYNQCGAICGTDAEVFVDVADAPLAGGHAAAHQCSCCVQRKAILQRMRYAAAAAHS